MQYYVDPSYPGLGGNRLFDASDTAMNRDGQMLPFIRLKQVLEQTGSSVQTADYLIGAPAGGAAVYWSFGLTDKLPALAQLPAVQRVGFLIMEPPLVAPHLYAALPELTRQFERVYVHNTEGDGYSLDGVDASRLRKLYWPQPYDTVQPAWSRMDRLNKSVVIAGRHTARRRKPEYYSLRIQAMAELARWDAVDLYGRGWAQLWSAQTLSWPYLRHYRTLRAIYKGSCHSKMDVLGQYRFSLCLENMPMRGYVTEKIFDCLYAGTVPLYLGAPDIEELIPPDAYVDLRQFDSWTQAWRYASAMPDAQWQRMRECGRDFIASATGQRYVHALETMFLHEDSSP